MKMKATLIYLTKRQREVLDKVSEIKGTSLSELIRRILDEWIDNNEKKL
jgi:hypothetical protein